MKYLDKKEINDILAANEKENVYHYPVEAQYAYELEEVTSGKTGTKVESQPMIRVKKDNKNYFILTDRYKDSEPSSFMITEKELANFNYKVLEGQIHSHNIEEERVNALLDKRIGGEFTNKNNGFTLFKGNNEIVNELTTFAKKLKESHLNDFYWAASQKRIDELPAHSADFNTRLETKINEMTTKYEKVSQQRNEENLINEQALKKEKQEQNNLQKLLVLQTAKAEVLEMLGYYPTITTNPKDSSDILISIHNDKHEVVDNFNVKLDMKDVLIGYDRHDDEVYESYSTINKESLKLIENKKLDAYFKTFYLLENAVIVENNDSLEKIANTKYSSVSIDEEFEIVLKNENSLIHSIRAEFKNPETLKFAEAVHQEFKDFIKPTSRNKMKM